MSLKLSLGVHVCGCLFLCGPVMDWRPRPMTAGIGSKPPRDPPDGLRGYRKWMDGISWILSPSLGVMAQSAPIIIDTSYIFIALGIFQAPSLLPSSVVCQPAQNPVG